MDREPWWDFETAAPPETMTEIRAVMRLGSNLREAGFESGTELIRAALAVCIETHQFGLAADIAGFLDGIDASRPWWLRAAEDALERGSVETAADLYGFGGRLDMTARLWRQLGRQLVAEGRVEEGQSLLLRADRLAGDGPSD